MTTFTISSSVKADIAFHAASVAAAREVSATVVPSFSSVKGAVEHSAEVRVFDGEEEALGLWDRIRNALGLGCAWWESAEHVGCSKEHPRALFAAKVATIARKVPPGLEDGRHNKGFPR